MGNANATDTELRGGTLNFSCRIWIDIRALAMTRQAGKSLDQEDMLDGNALPLVDGLTGKSEMARQCGTAARCAYRLLHYFRLTHDTP
jgi:hypothetical protein